MKASTGGSARPSLSPDSRFSEWRTNRGTRGFVTTLEESTGSVGDSSAPSRNASVQYRSMRAWAASATIARGDRHREDELAQRQAPLALQHLAVDLESVAEEDHDQRDLRELGHEARPGAEVEHLEAAVAEHEPGEHEHRRQREEAAARHAGAERADDEQHAEDQRGVAELRHARSAFALGAPMSGSGVDDELPTRLPGTPVGDRTGRGRRVARARPALCPTLTAGGRGSSP